MKQALNMSWQFTINLKYCYSAGRVTQNMSPSCMRLAVCPPLVYYISTLCYALSPACVKILAQDGANLFGHNSLVDWLRELFKRYQDVQRLVVSIFKKLGSFGFAFFVGDIIIGVGLGSFSSLHQALDQVWTAL